jgi:hypothetical protein
MATNLAIKASHLVSVTNALIEATKKVEAIYFELPVAGHEEPQFRERHRADELRG